MKVRPWFGWVSLGARLVLGGVMLVAGALKVTDPETAAQAVRAYELLPSALVEPVGWGLPFLEIAIGLLLLVGFGVRAAAVAAGVFMVVFIAAVASAWARGLAIDCGCFGGGGQVAPGQTKYLQEILRDLGLLALAAWLWLNPLSKFALETDSHTPTGATAS
ncbi:methylamine utilization protein MauE [Kribbella antiqua]|uniref:Methylamine utilization protein MauE n=1 Tax=Kribbella antiqua TaxID=2512217 RepID=A0A4R2J0G7_9ACTN|nr:MauE/DoxX family redox-associated membrane protein [Kribbella antiqua]TCO51711.1 methylamine utilization protein MauE [Kribbella antiqua]